MLSGCNHYAHYETLTIPPDDKALMQYLQNCSLLTVTILMSTDRNGFTIRAQKRFSINPSASLINNTGAPNYVFSHFPSVFQHTLIKTLDSTVYPRNFKQWLEKADSYSSSLSSSPSLSSVSSTSHCSSLRSFPSSSSTSPSCLHALGPLLMILSFSGMPISDIERSQNFFKQQFLLSSPYLFD
jgi:hypothetical protein